MKPLIVIALCALTSCGETPTPPANVVDTKQNIAWPSEGECNWYNLGNVGCGEKQGEFCVFGGLKCVTIFACGNRFPMGCH